MASKGVSGWTEEEVQERKEEYEAATKRWPAHNKGRPCFEDAYCLAKIPHQPDDYDGPTRYCMNTRVKELGDSYRCKYHGGNSNIDELHPVSETAAITHGMHATREHLVEDFDEKDEALYDHIVDSYADAYDIDPESDPSAAYDLHRLAAEIVRAERGRGFMLDEGEVKEQTVRDEKGRVVVDKDGEVVTEKSEHYLAQMMHRQDKKISDLEKELRVSRRERMKGDNADEAIEGFKAFAEVGKTILDRESQEFDGEEEPWEESGTE